MTVPGRASSAKISAVISDVDGTLVTDEKILTKHACAAVMRLREAGIAFAIVSSRPPRGLRMLIEPLGITTALAGFNGGVLAAPDLSVIEQHLLAPAVARRAVDLIVDKGAEPWVFSGQDWLVRDRAGPHVAHEERTVQFPPMVVADFGQRLDTAAKIVGVGDDAELLATCERAARAMLGGAATIARSQAYYLDVTHPLANKGRAVLSLAKRLGVPAAEIAVIGDGGNDVAMFERAGLGIAMGNAAPEVQRAADLVTGSNQADGFAEAVGRFILARAPAQGAGSP